MGPITLGTLYQACLSTAGRTPMHLEGRNTSTALCDPHTAPASELEDSQGNNGALLHQMGSRPFIFFAKKQSN